MTTHCVMLCTSVKGGRYLIVRGGTTILSIGASRNFISFSTWIEIPDLMVGRVAMISGRGRLLSLFDS